MDGILIIDKPAGITSHDVVSRCRRILKTKKIGHTGTLDPFATGVMVILVGKATRLAQFLDKDEKEYETLVRFGFETTTGDLAGEIKESSISDFKFQISKEELENALNDFRGEIWQTPPMFSAKKVDGKKLYELARKGVEIERKPVKITNYELRITNYESEKKQNDSGLWTLDFGLKVLCSAGTYIRVLAEDIGKKLKIGAHLAELRRTKAGKFGIQKAVSLEDLEKIVQANELDRILVSMNDALSHLPEIVLNEERIEKTKNGLSSRFSGETFAENQAFRMTDKDENLIAVGYFKKDEKIVQPKIVLV
jgi:tRNA pseudouridine55 synthase